MLPQTQNQVKTPSTAKTVEKNKNDATWLIFPQRAQFKPREPSFNKNHTKLARIKKENTKAI